MEKETKLVDELENSDYLNEIIETNREMDSLLLESDFALETAETELKSTIEIKPQTYSDDDGNTSSISIEVSEDLFKGFTSDINFSPLRYEPSNDEDSIKKLPDNLNNLIDDLNSTLKTYNEICQNPNNETFDEIDDDNDKTLVADDQKELLNTNKLVNIKSLVSITSDDEQDYLYIDLCNTTLEVTVLNESKENIEKSPVLSKLKNSDNFEGPSQEFNANKVGNEFTIILNTENTNTNTNINDDRLLENTVTPELRHVEKKAEFSSSENEFAQDNINFVSQKSYNENIEIITNPVPTENEIISPADTEITNDGFSVTYQNFIESELSNDTTEIPEKIIQEELENTIPEELEKTIQEELDETIQEELEKTIQEEHEKNIQEEPEKDIQEKSEKNIQKELEKSKLINTDLQNNNLKVTEEITINENNNVVTENLKRSGEDISVEKETKKIKLIKTATTTKDCSTVDESGVNFTHVIFDPEETADHNDPKWSVLKDLETNEDYFQSVRTQWRSLSLPNPHKSNTTRYVPANIAKIKEHTATSAEFDRAISCDLFLDKRIKTISQKICTLLAKMNKLPRLKGNTQRNNIQQELDHLRNIRREMEKNKEEIKHINMFYFNDSQGWNANYLTKFEIKELEEQNKILEFQKTFYKS